MRGTILTDWSASSPHQNIKTSCHGSKTLVYIGVEVSIDRTQVEFRSTRSRFYLLILKSQCNSGSSHVHESSRIEILDSSKDSRVEKNLITWSKIRLNLQIYIRSTQPIDITTTEAIYHHVDRHPGHPLAHPSTSERSIRVVADEPANGDIYVRV